MTGLSENKIELFIFIKTKKHEPKGLCFSKKEFDYKIILQLSSVNFP
jgi:hypothetical protein